MPAQAVRASSPIPGIHTVHILDQNGTPAAFAVLDADTIVLDTKQGMSYSIRR